MCTSYQKQCAHLPSPTTVHCGVYITGTSTGSLSHGQMVGFLKSSMFSETTTPAYRLELALRTSVLKVLCNWSQYPGPNTLQFPHSSKIKFY